MQDKRQVYRLWGLSKQYGQRPSEIVGVADEWAAYQFDTAILYMGGTIDGKLAERELVGEGKNAKYEPRYTLEQLLDDGPIPEFDDPHVLFGVGGIKVEKR